jgi:hypothetical protein
MSVPASKLRTSRAERQSEGSRTAPLYDGVTRMRDGLTGRYYAGMTAASLETWLQGASAFFAGHAKRVGTWPSERPQ